MRLALIFLCLPLAAATVTITDTIYDPYNVPWNGTVVIDCPSGTTAASVTIARQITTVTVTKGVFSQAIEVGDTGEPAGRSCTARFTATNTRQRVTWSETWYVTSASTTIGSVRVTTTPTTTTTLRLDQLSLTGAAKGSLIAFGTAWGPLLVGTNGYVLKADSTAARGIKWSASEASSGGAWGDILGTLSDQTDLQAALDAKVSTTTQIIGGYGLTGGGALSANRTIAVTDNSSNQKVIVSTSGTDVGTRKQVNFIAGDGISLTIGDNEAQDRVDVEIDSTGAATGYGTIQEEGTPIPQRASLNAVGAAITASDDAGAGRTLLTLSQSPTASTAVVGTGRVLTAASPITGGGDLSADRAFACPTCTTSAAAMTASRIIVGGGSQALAASSHVLPTGTVVGTTDTQTLTNKTLGVPSIADFSNATHDHSANSKGGAIPAAVAAGASGLMTGADKTKLDGIAAGAEVNVNADWSASTGDAAISNKPTLGTAAALDVGTTTGTVAAGDHGHSGVYEPADTALLKSAGTRTATAVTVFDANGNVIASDCSISGGTVSCGDGTEAALIALRELAANGTSEFGIYGAESLAADACIVMPATQPTEGQILKASASTATPTGTALTCRVMEWAADVGFANPMTTAEDLIIGGVSGAPARKAKGTDGKVLRMESGAIAWGDVPAMVGDSGSGGTAGLVPAPATGDAAAGKYLKADGTWTAPSGGTAVAYILTSPQDAIAGSATEYFSPGASLIASATETARYTFLGAAATITSFGVRINSTVAASTLVCTFRVAGENSELSVSYSTGEEGIKTDTGSVSVAADAVITVGCANGHSSTSPGINSFFLKGTWN